MLDKITMACPLCGKIGKAPSDYVGKPVRCRRCGNRFLLSARATEPLGQSSRESEVEAADAGVPSPLPRPEKQTATVGNSAPLVGSETTRTREIGAFLVVEGREALQALNARGNYRYSASPCAQFTRQRPPMPQFVTIHFMLRCRTCQHQLKTSVAIRPRVWENCGSVRLTCPGCRLLLEGGWDTADEGEVSFALVFPSATAMSIIDAVDAGPAPSPLGQAAPAPAPVPVACPMCRRDVPPRDGALVDGLCRDCYGDSLAALKMVHRNPFTCDACNESNPLKIGEIYKSPQISGSVYCKQCYPSAYGKAWRRER